MRALQIKLFGDFAVATAAGPFGMQSLPARLLAYLALAGGRPVSRYRLSGTLWPDVPEERARANLSTVVWRLKRVLSTQGLRSDLVVSVNESVRLDTESCDIDVDRFLASALDPRNATESLSMIERAVEANGLYRGDLLEEWDDEWCVIEREALRRRHLGNLQALAESFERRGRLDLALEFAQRAADCQPLDESLQLIVVRLLIRSGRKASARQHYSKFASAVRAEFGVDPDTDPLAGLETPVGGGTLSRTPEAALSAAALLRPSRIPMVGRVAERRALASLMDAAIADGGASVLILGEAGVGKTRLANWAMEEWVARGGVTGRGTCVEYNEPIPYQPLFDALDGVTDLAEVAAFLASGRAGAHSYQVESQINNPVVGRGDQRAIPRDTLRLFGWLKSKIVAACRQRPLMIVVEDLQWVDGGTLGFLMYLATQKNSGRLALVMTTRQRREQAPRFRIDQLSRHCTVMLKLNRLSKPETTALVGQILDGATASSEFVSWLQSETEGNPFFIIETLRLLSQRGGFDVPDDATDPVKGRLAIPDGVRSVVDQRLAYLEPAELRVAKVASVLGRTSDDELLGMVAGISQNTLSRHVAGLLRAGVFERDGAGYRFAHDKIREVCYEGLPAAAKRARHLRAAAVLAQRADVPAHSLAWHQANAGQWSLAAISWTVAGDRSREVYAYDEALQAYQQAMGCLLRHERLSPVEKATEEFRLLAKSDDVAAILGRTKRQHAIHHRMEMTCQRAGSAGLAARLYLRRAWLAGHEADFAAALQLGRKSWSIARSVGDLELQVEALHAVAWQMSRLGRTRRALQTYQLALKRDSGQPTSTRAALLTGWALAIARSGDLDAAEAALAEARQVLRQIGHLEGNALSFLVEAVVLSWRSSSAKSMAAADRAARLAQRTGDTVTSALAHALMLRINTLGGRLGDALHNLRVVRTLSRATGYRRTLAGCLNEVGNGIGRVIGTYEWAWVCVEQALALSSTIGTPLFSAVCLDSQAMILMDLGKYDRALEKIQSALEIYAANDGSLGPSRESLGRRGAIQLLRGDVGSALRDLSDAAQGQSLSGDRVILTDTLSYLALAQARAGDQEQALATSTEAVRVLLEIECTGYQPQRVFWQHYQILQMLGREPRVPYLRRAVDLVQAQAATLSAAQGRRLRTQVLLNRAILESWAQVLSQTPEATSAQPTPVAS